MKKFLWAVICTVVLSSCSKDSPMSSSGESGNGITITSSATGGTITPNGSTSIVSGSNQRYTYTPETNYRFDSVVVDGVKNLDSTTSYTFVNVTSSHTIKAWFSLSQYYLDSIAVITIPAKDRFNNNWDPNDGPDLYIAFGKSGVSYITNTSESSNGGTRNNVTVFPQIWNLVSKNIELKNENWRVDLYDDEDTDPNINGTSMFFSENVNPTTQTSPIVLTSNQAQGNQTGFQLRVYYSRR